MAASTDLRFDLISQSPYRYQATVTVPEPIVTTLYKEAVTAQKDEAHTYGFTKGSTPLFYIEHNFKTNLTTHIKEFLFHFFVVSFLYKKIYSNKLLLAADPELTTIEFLPQGDAQFFFLLDSINFDLYEWQHLIFKAPPRKNYKDIDRQVVSFIKQEEQSAQDYQPQVSVGDWVCFDICIVNHEHKPLFGDYSERLWLKIGDEEADKEFQEAFLGRKLEESFYTNVNSFQEYFSNYLDTHYEFLITIRHIVPYKFFSLEYLRHHFALKKTKDIHKKLIEVFSYRNDLSQRRETVESIFKLLLNYHAIDLPDYLLEHQQKQVLEAVHNNPDYLVYKAQADFKNTVRKLAEKQLKEALLMDLITYMDAIDAEMPDVCAYMAFSQRARMKELVYFDHPSTKRLGQEMPIPHSIIRHSCLREKALNHVIHTLAYRR